MVNADLRQKIISQKDYDEKENEIFYITLDLCIDEGNNDVQLWERYRPDHKVKISPQTFYQHLLNYMVLSMYLVSLLSLTDNVYFLGLEGNRVRWIPI